MINEYKFMVAILEGMAITLTGLFVCAHSGRLYTKWKSAVNNCVCIMSGGSERTERSEPQLQAKLCCTLVHSGRCK